MVIFTNCGLLSNKPTRGRDECPPSLFVECLGAQVTVLALILLLPSLRYDLCNPVSIFHGSQELCLWCLGEHRWCCQFTERVSVPGAWVLSHLRLSFLSQFGLIHLFRCSTMWGPWKGSSFRVQIEAMRPQKCGRVKFGEPHEGDVECWSSGLASKEKNWIHVVVHGKTRQPALGRH